MAAAEQTYPGCFQQEPPPAPPALCPSAGTGCPRNSRKDEAHQANCGRHRYPPAAVQRQRMDSRVETLEHHRGKAAEGRFL